MVNDVESTVDEKMTGGKMPESIATAVVSVIKSLGVLSKDQINSFDKYEYASIDDFIKFVRGDAAESGLFFIPQEAREPELKELVSKSGKTLLMWSARYAFTICHESGETYGPVYKTVMVQASGAQSAGSAQSYALKQLMRALFLIPTGEKDDPDKIATEGYTSNKNVENHLQKEAQRIRNALESAKTEQKVRAAWGANSITLADIKEKSTTAYEFLEQTMNEKLSNVEKDTNIRA